MIDERSMQDTWLRGLHAAWRHHGLDADRLFAQADVHLGRTHDLDTIVLTDRISQLWEIALDVTGDPLVGARTAPRQPAGSLGPVAHLVLACPTLLEALQRLCSYVDLIMPTTTARLERRLDVVRLTLHLRAGRRPIPPQRYDYLAGLTLHVMEWMIGIPVRPLLTCLTFEPAADVRLYESLYGSPVRFAQSQCTMDFRAEDLLVKLPTANAMVAEWCNRLASDMVETRKGRMSMRVKKHLLEMLSKGDPRRDIVAEHLRLSERTLQRRLAEEGTNFQDLVDQTRRELAHQFLSIGRLTPKEMSFELGFSDPSNFYRACKRWFGQSPREFRLTL